MKKLFTSSAILKLLLCTVLTGAFSVSKAVHTPMTFQPGKGFKYDVVVDAVPSIPTPFWTFATGSIDTSFSWSPVTGGTARWGLVSTAAFPTGLPTAGGNLTSVNAAYNFPVYTLAPTNADNAIHIRTNNHFDTLLFNNQTLIGDVYLLGAAGGDATNPGPGGTATVTFLFANGTTHAVTGVAFPNYRDTTKATGSNFAIANIGRYNITASSASAVADDGRPRLFDIRVALPYNLYGNQIKGIRIQKTGGDQINVLGVCVDHNPCLPTATVFQPDATPAPPVKITFTNPIRWRQVAGTSGYQMRLEAYPTMTTPFTTATMPLFPSAAATIPSPDKTAVNDTSLALTGLTPNTVYVFFVRAKCGTTDASVWNAISFKTPDCATPTGINWEVSQAASRTTTSLRLKWNKTSAYTAASPTHIQFEYALTQDPTNSPTGGTFFTTDTLFHFKGLKTCGMYYLWVRNNCVGSSWGPWTKNGTAFQVACCPSAGQPDTVAGTNVPGAVTLKWPGSKDSAITTYQYQLVLNTPGTPVHTDWVNTNDTFVVFPNAAYPVIDPGQQYKFFVRSYCTDTASAAVPPSRIFTNPFYRCDTPANPNMTITNINMHGAQIDWSPGSSVAPYPIQMYNVAIQRNLNNTALLTTRNPATNPPQNNAYWLTTDTFFHPTTLTPDDTFYVHVRTECDTVTRNRTVATPPITYNWSPWVTRSFITPATCVPPITPTITNVTHDAMHAEWNLYYGILGYEYYIDEQPGDPTSPPASWPLISYNMVDPINLFSNTNYWFHLRTKCNATTYSPWTNTPFTTLALCNNVTPAPALQPSGGTPNPAATSAIFNWPAIANASAYDCAVTTTPTPPATPDATVSITTYTAQGLTPNTNYYFHLKANCSPNDATSWVSLPFTTDFPTNVTDLRNGVSVLVYPNPTNDDVTVDIQNNPKGTIQVLDMTGKVIYTTETAEQKTIVNMKPFASGVYMIKFFVDPANTQVIRIQKL